MTLRATVRCSRCDDAAIVLTAHSLDELAALTSSAILCVHATKAHVTHVVSAEPEIGSLPPEKDWPTILLRCLVPGCAEKGQVTELEVRAPLVLAPAIALLFHSAHEGHAFRLSVGGYSWETPIRG